MPRKSKGARLELRAARRDASGRVTHQATWRIRDGQRDIGTGCAAHEVAAAEKRLSEYLASKHTPKRRTQDIEQIEISDVLSIYLDVALPLLHQRHGVTAETEDTIPAIRKFKGRIARLNAWWGGKTLDHVTGDTSRAYAKERKSPGGARRDLEDLRSAINHHAEEGFHRGIVHVVLPPKGQPRDRWLTRSEAARLLRICWRHRELQTRHRGADKGRKLPTDKRPLRHLARFILIGLYTGTRAGAIASASPIPAIGRSYVDLERGVYYRRAQGNAETNKRQPPVRLPPRLLAHMRRWHARGLIARHFVEFNGEAVSSVKTGFKSAIKLAKIEGRVSPHTLRHTAATWLMQSGADLWQAAGYLGMSVETLERVYGHHHPDHQADAVQAAGRGGRHLPKSKL